MSWDEDLVTVPPQNVDIGIRLAMTKARLRGLKFPRDYKLIAHYVQPHAPYVSLKEMLMKVVRGRKELMQEVIDIVVRKQGVFTGRVSMDHVLLGMLKDYLRSEDKVRKVLQHAYRENLRWVLKYVAEIIPYLGGRIVITSDHGELLGEYGLYFHVDLPLPHLRIVPWFIVK